MLPFITIRSMFVLLLSRTFAAVRHKSTKSLIRCIQKKLMKLTARSVKIYAGLIEGSAPLPTHFLGKKVQAIGAGRH